MDRERVRKIVVMGLASLVLLLSLSPIVFGGWSETSSSGDWLTKDRELWSAMNTMQSGEVLFSFNESDGGIADFEGYYASIFFSKLVAEKVNWWSLQTNKRVIILWNFSNVYVYLNFLEQHNLFGWVHDRWVQVGVSTNSTAFTTSADFWWNPFAIQTERDDFLNFPSTIEVYVDKVSATEIKVDVLNCRADKGADVLMWSENIAVDASWFTNNVSATMSVYHEGKGHFEGIMTDTIYTTSWGGHSGSTMDIEGFGIWDFIDNLMGGAVRVLPSWLQDYVFQLGSWFGWLIGAVPFFSQFIGVILPVLPYFFLFWILDAVFSCIVTGNISPLGVCFSTIIGLGSNVIGVLVSIIGTIYDFIHIW
mgnify:CR=1 FL=1